jgi:hypothetical protein
MQSSPREVWAGGIGRLRAPSQAAVVGISCLIAVVLVAIVQVLHVGELMDVNQRLNAGHAQGLVGAYTLAAFATFISAAALPQRWLWLPVAAAAAMTALVLALSLVLGGELWSFVWAVLTFAACWQVGRWLLDAAGTPSLAKQPVVAWLAGVGAVGLVLLGVGRAGGLSWLTAAGPILIVGSLGTVRLARSLGLEGARAAWSTVTSARLAAASAALCLLAAGLASIWAAAPELGFDALYYKAWLPSEWARTGEITPVVLHPLIAIWGFGQVIAIPGHVAGADGVGRYLQWLAQGSLVLTVWWTARRSAWAPLAGAALALTPLLFWEETTAYDDALLALAGAGMAVAVFSALRPTEDPPVAVGFVIGALAGVCVDLKLHLAPLAAGLLLGWLVMRRGSWKAPAAALLAAVAVAAPPMIIRWIDLDNPVMPLYNNVFKSPYWFATSAPFGSSPGQSTGSSGPPEPLDTVWDSLVNTERWGQPVGAIGLLALAVTVALLVGWRRGSNGRGVIALWLGLLVAVASWYWKFSELRYLPPMGAVAVLILVLSTGTRPPGRRLQTVGLAGLLATAVLLWPATVAQFWNVPGKGLPWRAAFGRIGDLEYERQATSDRELVAAFDRIAPPGALAAADPHERAWLTDGRDLTPIWEIHGRLATEGLLPETPAETLAAVRADGVSWVLAWNSGSLLSVLPYLQRMVDVYGKPVFSSPGGTLYRLPDPQNAEPRPRIRSLG